MKGNAKMSLLCHTWDYLSNNIHQSLVLVNRPFGMATPSEGKGVAMPKVAL